MFRQFLQQVPGADFYMIGSLMIFLVFFFGVGLYLLTGDKEKFQEMAQLPLNQNINEINNDN
jgi:cbb3-type cytochrome oxidase subunit 3